MPFQVWTLCHLTLELKKEKCYKVGPILFSSLGIPNSDLSNVVAQATTFISIAYGQTFPDCKTKTKCRTKMWQRRIAGNDCHQLAALPPTTEAFTKNVKRAHLQVALWRSALEGINLTMNPCDFGWEVDDPEVHNCTRWDKSSSQLKLLSCDTCYPHMFYTCKLMSVNWNYGFQ